MNHWNGQALVVGEIDYQFFTIKTDFRNAEFIHHFASSASNALYHVVRRSSDDPRNIDILSVRQTGILPV
jgi:hypothetical protein